MISIVKSEMKEVKLLKYKGDRWGLPQQSAALQTKTLGTIGHYRRN